MKRKIYLYWGNDEKYEVASDATISEEYSETLDSASVVLPNLKSASGIVYGAKPYDEVYLSVVLDDGTEEVGRWMLIDSVDAAQTSFSGTAYFDVTLQLMSETKYLEKKQLPNVAITHSLTTGGRTLYNAIKYYLDTYAVEYTGESSRKRLIEIDDTLDWSRFKNAACADVMMSKPTLRQCLTTLMSQVGCIPVVNHRKLSWLDLGAERTSFGLAAKGSVRRSVSSDSWVNAIVSESSQCVDESSSCVMEQLCFRDRDNVLLKQESNLKLETRYPIYSVKKLVLNAYVQGKPQFNHSTLWSNAYRMFSAIGFVVGATSLSKRGGLNVDFKTVNGVPYLRVVPWCADALAYVTAQGTMTFKQTLAKVGSNGGLTAIKTMTSTASVSYSAVKQSDAASWSPIYAKTFGASDYTGNEITLVVFSFSGTLSVSGQAWKESEDNLAIGFATDSVDSTYAGDVAIDDHGQKTGYFSAYQFPYSGYWASQVRPYAFYKDSSKTYGFRSRTDITPLCVEATKRGQLEVDFLKMPTWSDIETMSKYLYATVGYSVGGNAIEGFSAKYSYSKGFWNVDKTYIENIIDSLGIEREGVNHFYADAFPQAYWRFIFERQTITNPFFSSRHNFFSLLTFDVEYIPLIQAKACYPKEDVPLPLEQLDSAESGVSSMDSVSALEEQKADRLGNPVFSVHARVGSYSDLPALNSEWNGKVAFKRTLKFGANAIDAEYMLSEDYVIKNYFTSIVTKYRAFEYVDYSQSVERRELVSAYIRLSSSGAGNEVNAFPLAAFPNAQGVADTLIDSLQGYQSGKSKLTGGGFLPTKAGYIAECELSAVATGDKAIFTIKEYDNASDGPYVDGTYLTVNGTYKDDPIGGIPQKWYEGNGGQVWPIIFHSETKPLYSQEWGEDASAFLQSAVRMAQQYPRYYFQGSSSVPTSLDYAVYWQMTLPFDEKDISELLSVSVQFEAYWDGGKGKARFSKWLYRFSSALGGYPSESAYLAYRKMGDGEQWTGAKRSAAASSFTKLDCLLTTTLKDGVYLVKGDAVKACNASPIEVAVINPADGGAAYPLAWFAKGVLASFYVYMSCVPTKSDKALLESASRSLLYEKE